MQGYTQTDPVGTLKKKKPNSNHNFSQDCALQKPPETLLETQLQDTQMEKKYLHPGRVQVFDYWDFEFSHPIFDRTTTQRTRSITTPTGNVYTQRHTRTVYRRDELATTMPFGPCYDQDRNNCGNYRQVYNKDYFKLCYPDKWEKKYNNYKRRQWRRVKYSKETFTRNLQKRKAGECTEQHKDWKKYFDTIAEKLRQRIAESAGNTECSSSNGSDTDSYKSKENTPEATGGASLGTTKEETSPGRKREVGSPSSKIGSTEWVDREPKPKKLCK